MLNFDPALIAPYFRTIDTTVGLSTNISKQLLAPNVNRVLAAFVNTGFAVNIRPGLVATSTSGFSVASGAVPLIFDFAQYGSIVGGSWSAFIGPGTTSIWILEVLYYPPGR